MKMLLIFLVLLSGYGFACDEIEIMRLSKQIIDEKRNSSEYISSSHPRAGMLYHGKEGYQVMAVFKGVCRILCFDQTS